MTTNEQQTSQVQDNQFLEYLINETVSTFNQLSVLIQSISEDDYKVLDDRIFLASIGAHVRHVLEHYLLFCEGISNGVINYDLRKREKDIEFQPETALQTINELSKALKKLSGVDKPLSVIVDLDTTFSDSENKSGYEQPSSTVRELTFLHSHSVHHFATISHALRARKIDLPASLANFGIAPATVRYRESLQCAH